MAMQNEKKPDDTPAAKPPVPDAETPGQLRCRSALLVTAQAAAVRFTRRTRVTTCLYDVNGGYEARRQDAGPPKGTARLRKTGPTQLENGDVLALDGTITFADIEKQDAALLAAAKNAPPPPPAGGQYAKPRR